MNIPQVLQEKLVDKDGNIHPVWRNIFEQLFTQMQANLSDEGYKVPQQSSSHVTLLNTPKSVGALLYDKERHKLVVNINGTFEDVTTTPIA